MGDKFIGGYFGLEEVSSASKLTSEARLMLSSGRACLRVLLESIRPSRVFVPFYCCDTLLAPFSAANVDVLFYRIDERFRPQIQSDRVSENDVVVRIHYFGLGDPSVGGWLADLQQRLWLDQTHAFFADLDPNYCSFNSARKWFGVPDGAYLNAPEFVSLPGPAEIVENTDITVEHLLLRRRGDTRRGYQAFCENEDRITGEVARMSTFTQTMLAQIDFEKVKRQRRANFTFLHERLYSSNQISHDVTNLLQESVPFCYPFLPKSPISHARFWDQGIFVPRLWSECVDRQSEGFNWEKKLSSELLPLPVDQRYGEEEMTKIIEVLNRYGR